MGIFWVLSPDERSLCAHGYPIRIRMIAGDKPFVLDVDGRSPLSCSTLALAKTDAERIAREMDEFTPGGASAREPRGPVESG